MINHMVILPFFFKDHQLKIIDYRFYIRFRNRQASTIERKVGPEFIRLWLQIDQPGANDLPKDD